MRRAPRAEFRVRGVSLERAAYDGSIAAAARVDVVSEPDRASADQSARAPHAARARQDHDHEPFL